MSKIELNNKLFLTLHPESCTSAISAPEGSIGEIVSKRKASQKHYAMPDGKTVVYCYSPDAPVHYQDDYSIDTDWKEIDPTYYEDQGDHYLFNHMPHDVRVFKHKIGYEITDRQTGKVMSAELLEIDDAPVTQSKFVSDIKFDIEVQAKGIRLWKETGENGPTKFRWKIQESVQDSKLKFREEPEAFDRTKLLADTDLESLTEEEKESALVNVSVKKTKIKEGFIWEEEVSQTGLKIDTDFTSTTADRYLGGYATAYYVARSQYNTSNTTAPTIRVGQRYNSAGYFYVYRAFVLFDTSSVSSIDSANLKITIQSVDNTDSVSFNIQIVKQHWAVTDDRDDNYDDCLSGTEDATSNITESSSGTVTSNDLDTSHINTSGNTGYSFRSSRDKSNIEPDDDTFEWLHFYSAEETTAAYRPVLVITLPPEEPTVTTSACDEILASTTRGNGNVTDSDGLTITRRGFCYFAGTTGDPDTSDSVAYDDGSFSTGAFTKTISGLSPETTYRVRAYAVSSAGTGYGTTVSVTTESVWQGKINSIEDPVKILGIDGSNVIKVCGIASAE